MTDRIDTKLAEKIDNRFGLEPSKPGFTVLGIIKDTCGYVAEFLGGIGAAVLLAFGIELL